MNNLKRTMALLMSSVICVSAFASCSSTAPGTAGGTSGKVSGGAEPNAGQKAEGSGEPVELSIYTWGIGQAVTPSDDAAIKRVTDYIVEKINVKPKLVMAPSGTEVEKLNLLLASNEQLDLFKGNWTTYQPKNVIIPINEVLEKYGKDVKAAWPEAAWTAMTDKEGQIWGVAGGTPTTPYPTFFREDWLKACNLTPPTNFDEFENVLKAFKEKDFAGNGTTIPLITSLTGLRYCLSGGYTGVGYGQWLDPSDQTIKPVELMPQYKDFVVRMADWYKKGYIFKESFAGNVIRDMIKQNKVGVHADWYSNITLSENTLQMNVPEAHYVMAPMAGPASKISETVAKGGQGGVLITKRCKDPEAAMRYINFGYEDIVNFIVMKDGIQGVDWEWQDEALKINKSLNPDQITYRGELSYIPLGIAIEKNLNTVLPDQKMHYEYLRKDCLAYDRTLKPADYTVFYNKEEIKKKLPNEGDINTMLDEQTVAFISGTRPIAEWDKFLEELNGAGLAEWSKIYTESYNEMNG